ncbi:RNA polymerase sigma factor [Streptosporangium canum]
MAETFTVAWRRMGELPPGQEARLWLYGVARKVLADHRRSTVRQRLRSVELDAEMADLYGDSPDSGVGLSVIAAVFRSLSDDDRELLSLVAWEGLDARRSPRRWVCHATPYASSCIAPADAFRALDEAGVRFASESRMVATGRSL